MFVGRKHELQALEKLYKQDKFQMVVVYGRRRIGKTTLINKFIEGKPALFFTAQETNDAANLTAFSKAVLNVFGDGENFTSFNSWDAAFDYVAKRAAEKPFVLVFDEFPYAANANTGLSSILQAKIDHVFKNSKLYLILCGSQISFMETEVLGYKSPLFGRRTAQIELHGLDYYDASKLLTGFTNEEKVVLYGCFGGTPHYLEQIDHHESVIDNIVRLYFDIAGYMYNEPVMLLRQELRNPAAYNALITNIALGATRVSEIAGRLQTESNRISKYLETLQAIRIIKRVCPFDDNPLKSRKSQYWLADNAYLFWYHFVFPQQAEIENGSGALTAKYSVFGAPLAHYIGKPPFEDICLQFLQRLNKDGKLPFEGLVFGSWWGTDNRLKQPADVDVVMANKFTGQLLLGECKWRNDFDQVKEIEKLLDKGTLFGAYKEIYYAFFSKVKYTSKALEIAKKNPRLLLFTVEDMFAEQL